MDHTRGIKSWVLKAGHNHFKTLQTNHLPFSFVILLLAILAVFLRFPSKKRDSASGKICIGSTVSKREYEDVINNFLRDISFRSPNPKFDAGLKNRVINCLGSNGISRDFIPRIERCIDTATKIASCTYPFVSHEALEAIAVYASYVISIDDLTSEIIPDLELFGIQFALGQSQSHELLRGFSKFLCSQQRLFGSFGGDMIVKGSMEFLSSAVVEHHQDKYMHLPPEASDYLVFFRAKTGVAEPFAFFCFPEDENPESRDLTRYLAAVPSIMLLLGYVNDLFSFYKEELEVEDSPGFMRNYSKVNGLTSLQSLREIQHETIKVAQKIRGIFANDIAMLDHMDQFINGYVFYHLCSGRYKLSELDIPTAIEAKQCFREMAKTRK